MKTIFKLGTSAVLCTTLFLYSCSENGNDENIDFSIESIESIVNEMQTLANTIDKTVYANIILDENNRFIASNIEILYEFEIGFAEGFSGKKMSESITVSYSDGNDTHCEGSGLSLYRCIGNAIKDCLDAGGCAEVCSAGMTVEPK